MMDVSISGLYNGEWGNFGCGASGSNIPRIVNKIVKQQIVYKTSFLFCKQTLYNQTCIVNYLCSAI